MVHLEVARAGRTCCETSMLSHRSVAKAESVLPRSEIKPGIFRFLKDSMTEQERLTVSLHIPTRIEMENVQDTTITSNCRHFLHSPNSALFTNLVNILTES